MKRTAVQASEGLQDLSQAEGQEMLDVDFDFFNFSEIDFKALSLLMRQLLSHDAKMFEFGSVADFLIADNALGSTVKCDGQESDPYAFCTVLDLSKHAQHPAISPLREYFLSKTQRNAQAAPIASLLQAASPSQPQDQHVGLILNERLLNMPPHITAPFLRLIAEEMAMAEEQNLPFKVNHLLYFSRIFVPSEEDNQEGEGEDANKKPKRTPKATPGGGAHVPSHVPYHIEDESIAEFASCICEFDFTNEPEPTDQPRREDAFGVAERGRLMLLSLDSLPRLIERLEREGQ